MIALQTNNFNFIRVIAAAMVIITHTYVLIGLGTQHDFLYQLSNGEIMISTLGLRAFFIISGYLIIQSMEKSTSYGSYFKKRILRVFPGLIACILFIILVLGAIYTSKPIFAYYTSATTWKYLYNISLYKGVFIIPSVFDDHIIQVINGSIWTLAYEFSYYIMVMVLCAIGIFKRKWIAGIVFCCFFCLQLLTIYTKVPGKFFYFLIYTDLQLDYFSDFGLFFSAGMLMYLYRATFTYTHRVAVLMLLFYICSIAAGVPWVMKYVAIPYLIMYVAFLPSYGFITHWGKKTDLSYGIYIYGMPAQQVIIGFVGTSLHPELISLLSLVLVLPIAWLSWHLIEKHFTKKAISLKSI